MVNKVKIVINRAKLSCENLFTYSNFVNDTEFFAEQLSDILNLEQKNLYYEIWCEMEIINALALNDWEECRRPDDFMKIWVKKYKKDAINSVSKITAYLENTVRE